MSSTIYYNQAARDAGLPANATHYVGDTPSERTYYIVNGSKVYSVNSYNWSSGTEISGLPANAKAFHK